MKNLVWIVPYMLSGYCYGAGTVLALDTHSPNAWGWPWFVVAGTACVVTATISFFIKEENGR